MFRATGNSTHTLASEQGIEMEHPDFTDSRSAHEKPLDR